MPQCKLFYHFVWATKYRNPTITDLIRADVYASIVHKSGELDARVHALNGMEEHAHLVVELPPTLAPATFIGQVKGYSSHSTNRLALVRLGPRFEWQEEYSVRTFAERQLPIIVRYVENRQIHHARGRLRKALEDW